MDSSKITDGTIVNADLSSNAAIADTKLATITTAGKVADTALSTNVAFLNGTNVFTGTNRFAGVVLATNANNQFTGGFTGNGAGLTNLSGANLASGTVADARLSANVALRAGGNNFTGNQVISGGNVTVGGFNIVTATTNTPTAGSTVTPTSGYVTLTPASTVTLNATTALAAGSTPADVDPARQQRCEHRDHQ